MSKYKVLVQSATGGWTEVEANNEEEANAAAELRIANEGADCIYKITFGEHEVVGSAEKV